MLNRNLLPNYGTEQDIASGQNVMFKTHPSNVWATLEITPFGYVLLVSAKPSESVSDPLPRE